MLRLKDISYLCINVVEYSTTTLNYMYSLLPTTSKHIENYSFKSHPAQLRAGWDSEIEALLTSGGLKKDHVLK